MISKAIEIAETERRFGLDVSVDDAIKELKFGLVEVVYEWANGMASETDYFDNMICFQYHYHFTLKEFIDITKLTDVSEGERVFFFFFFFFFLLMLRSNNSNI